MPPQLFMDPATDVGDDSWGLTVGRPTALTPDARLALPPVNYTAGATVFAAFTTRAVGLGVASQIPMASTRFL